MVDLASGKGAPPTPPNPWSAKPPHIPRQPHGLPGRFITFEGPDGAGKSSNIEPLQETLESLGYEVVLSREPGGTPTAEQLREILLSSPVGTKCELLLFAAARANHVETKIKPALAQGKIVLCDRFADSTYAYQGIARGFKDDVLMLEEYVLGGFEPDYTLFFDVTLEESARRLNSRNRRAGDSNHFDQAREDFKARVYQGYMERFHANPHRMVHIDAMQKPQDVAYDVKTWARAKFHRDYQSQ